MAQGSHKIGLSKISRTRFTWLAYLMLGFYAYMQASLGPLMPFLREEFSLNYTVAGLHFSAFALGMILAGSNGEYIAQHVGRKTLFWLGGFGMSLGALVLTFGQSAVFTISGAFVMGFAGSYLLVMIQALLSDEFGEQRAIALTESNLSASIFATCAPLVIAFSGRLGLDWRAALWLGGLFYLIMLLSQYQVSHPASKNNIQESDNQATKNLPPIYRLYWFVVFIGVAIEWCMIFWLADFLITVRHIPAELASSFVSLFLGAMIVGRVLGSRLTRYWSVVSLLLGMSIMIMIGFPLFWLGQDVIWQVLGLVVIGLGLSNLFPLGLSAASNVGASNVDKASARVSQAAGLAILIVPQTLGTLADSWGIFRAYGVLPVLLLVLIVLLIYANFQDKRRPLQF